MLRKKCTHCGRIVYDDPSIRLCPNCGNPKFKITTEEYASDRKKKKE